jgi:hypothetical protein
MARVHHTFTMELAPEQSQELFVRDIVPDLHRDGRFTAYREAPGELRLSDADLDNEPAGGGRLGAQALDLDDIADPDEFEAHDEEAGEPVLADVLRRGVEAETPAAGGGQGSHSLDLLLSHRLKVTFESEGGGTRVSIRGSAHDDVGEGLERLGTARHWPETAGDPHD